MALSLAGLGSFFAAGCEDGPTLLTRGNGQGSDASTTLPANLDPRSAAACAKCHGTVFTQWTGSMHARAATSPAVVAQTNQVARGPLANQSKPDPTNVCVNCHTPVGAALLPSATLPVQGVALAQEGVTCVTCHGWNGTPESGSGGSVAFQSGLVSGPVAFGTFAEPVKASAHSSVAWGPMKDANDLCASCHDVHVDRNADGKIEKGTDLVLQTTAREYKKYRDDGGPKTCIECHMPGLAPGRAAEGARIPEEQASEAPPRALHDHGFVGVDAPLDGSSDVQTKARSELLRGAARIGISGTAAFGGTVELDASITNVASGHNLPTGFAFARQMWLEVVVRRANGAIVDASGLLANESDDLCDASTYDAERAMRPFFVGCSASDSKLVNFQQKLVDRVEVVRNGNGSPVLDGLGDPRLAQHGSGLETFLQQLPGGAVPRTRPSDNQTLGTIAPGETRRFSYTMEGSIAPGEEVKISVRLLFRALPPYFLRALASGQTPSEVPRVADLPARLHVVEMAAAQATARRQ